MDRHRPHPRNSGSGVLLIWGSTAEVANIVAMASRSAWTTFPRGPLTTCPVNSREESVRSAIIRAPSRDPPRNRSSEPNSVTLWERLSAMNVWAACSSTTCAGYSPPAEWSAIQVRPVRWKASQRRPRSPERPASLHWKGKRICGGTSHVCEVGRNTLKPLVFHVVSIFTQDGRWLVLFLPATPRSTARRERNRRRGSPYKLRHQRGRF
jgi:hypothetical protein